MLAERFPDSIRYGATGGPGFMTTIVSVRSGAESRNRDWSLMRHRYDVSQCIQTESEFAAVRAHFMNAGGRELAFPYKDWADHTCLVADGVVEEITSTTFLLFKEYKVGSATTNRLIRLPRAEGFAVFVSGTPVAYTLDTATGILTIASAPDASTVTWSGEFDVLVRYDIDTFSAQITSKSGEELVMDWSSIPLVEVTDE